MIRPTMTNKMKGRSWPRTSGDDPDCLDTDIREYVLAPHERG